MGAKISILLVCALIFSACAAIDIGPAATSNGLLRAVQNAPGTFMMASEKLIMVAWPQGTNYGFAVFTKDGQAVEHFRELAACCGTKASSLTMAELVKFLKAEGWERIYSLPAATVAQIRSLASYFGVGATSTFTIFVLPAPMLEFEINPKVES